MCFDIDSADISDSTIVERSPRHGLSAASEICNIEDPDNGGVPRPIREGDVEAEDKLDAGAALPKRLVRC